MKEEIIQKLKDFPDFRERRFRVKYLVILTLRSLELEEKYNKGEPLGFDEMAEFAVRYESYNRAWRQCLEENKDLQGQDYDDRKIYEQKKILSLGYEIGYHNNLKQAELL